MRFSRDLWHRMIVKAGGGMADSKAKKQGKGQAAAPAPASADAPLHRYRSHTCGALRENRHRQGRAPLGLGAPRARPRRRSCSSTCATTTGSTQVVADPDSPAFKVAETLRSEWVVRVDGKRARAPRGHASTPSSRPARSSCSRPRSRCSRRQRSCRSRCSASPTIRKICACSTAFSICAARRCTRTSCSGSRSRASIRTAHARSRLLRVLRRRS